MIFLNESNDRMPYIFFSSIQMGEGWHCQAADVDCVRRVCGVDCGGG